MSESLSATDKKHKAMARRKSSSKQDAEEFAKIKEQEKADKQKEKEKEKEVIWFTSFFVRLISTLGEENGESKNWKTEKERGFT
jgi:hypothetical protein